MASKLNTQQGGVVQWAHSLLAEDFTRGCREDRFCVGCLAAFCAHCCGDHLHLGHDVVRVGNDSSSGAGRAAVVAVADLPRLLASPGAVDLLVAAAAARASRSGGARRESFCVDCAAGFASALCDHHGGHETVRVVLRYGRHCVRCTGSEPWFEAFDGVMTYKDDSGSPATPAACWCRCIRGGIPHAPSLAAAAAASRDFSRPRQHDQPASLRQHSNLIGFLRNIAGMNVDSSWILLNSNAPNGAFTAGSLETG